ncbi:glycosyltransferase family 2 protein [Prolixibacter sp. NT017]|uniref:glycosyltransferase family 2 protein n=1 Tax=Prolixibacter sp. NT017 TaxID=2652390 RepID=UPI00127A0590|nr:glycosyltransferase family 2 protein [Prolixibacter sp. NT017]GET24468.1 hypothetical protein NT017_07970 [Prolixibacter sp. NT017]
MQHVAILITSHNRKDKTIDCIKSINVSSQHLRKNPDIFLVDDGSSDGTSEALKKEFPNVYVIQGDGNLYWNRGMHTAWKAAVETKIHNFYLWLNDDTILAPTALTILLQASATFHDEAIIVGSTSATHDPSKITYGGRTWKGKLIPPTNQPIACKYFNGNMVLIPQQVYQKVGMNDPVYHHSLGDFDYGLRAAKAGISMMIAPGIMGTCDAHEQLPTWCNPEKTFKKRWKAFRTPLGHNPEEYFIFERRRYGLGVACFHYITNHLRVCFPQLWKG